MKFHTEVQINVRIVTFAFVIKINQDMKVGDKVLISPDLTLLKEWIAGTVIQVEDNPFVGTVISAETEDKNIFFGRAEMFKPVKEDNSNSIS